MSYSGYILASKKMRLGDVVLIDLLKSKISCSFGVAWYMFVEIPFKFDIWS